MAMETLLLVLLGAVAVWLVIDAGRERHRLRARMSRAGARRSAAEAAHLGEEPRLPAGPTRRGA